MTHAGRNVYKAMLGPFLATDGAIEYYASAPGESKGLTDHPQAPMNVYTLNHALDRERADKVRDVCSRKERSLPVW